MASFNIKRITEVPIMENTLYIIDIDDTLFRDDADGKQILNDPSTNRWLRAINRVGTSGYYICTYRKESGNNYTRQQFRNLGLSELSDVYIDYTTDKGDSVDNVIGNAIDNNNFNPWNRFVFIDDNPQAHQQMIKSRAYTVNPNGFKLYMIDPYNK